MQLAHTHMNNELELWAALAQEKSITTTWLTRCIRTNNQGEQRGTRQIENAQSDWQHARSFPDVLNRALTNQN